MTRKPAPKNLSCERQLDECPMNAPCHNGWARDSLNTEADPKSHLKSRRQSQTLAKHRLCHRPTCRTFDQGTNFDRNFKLRSPIYRPRILCLVRPGKGRVIVETFSQSGQMFDESSSKFLLYILSLENILRIFQKCLCCIYFRMRIFLHTVRVSRIAQFLKI